MRLDRQFDSIRSEVSVAINHVLERGNVLQSEEVVIFERRIADLCGTRYAVAVNSGTDALTFALIALDLPRGSRIGVTTMSFVASASAILAAGHTPVFFDIVPETMLMDLEATISSIALHEIDAVLAVHLYGQALDIETLHAAANAYGIPLIEDAAQTLGAMRNGRPVGGTGVAGCLSFDPTKVIGAYGSGGAIVTNDESFAKKIQLLRYHGHAGDQRYVIQGFNSQLDSIQAAILNVKLNHIAEWRERRASIAALYDDAIDQAGLRRMVTLQGNIHNYHKYVVWAPDRIAIQQHIYSAGVQTKIQYPIPLHRQTIFNCSTLVFPNVEEAAEHIFSLPIYAELTNEEVSQICTALKTLP